MARHCPACHDNSNVSTHLQSRQALGTFDINECGGCSHRFLPNPPSQETLNLFYDDNYGQDERIHAPGKPGLRDRALARTLAPHLPERARVLDVGANFGSTLLAFPESYDLTGIELSKPAADAAARHPRLKILRQAIEQIELPPASFDCILALAVIEHIMDTGAFLAKLKRLLRPQGILVLMTGDYQSWHAQTQEDAWNLYHCDGHLHFFSARSLEAALKRQGFSINNRLWVGPNRLTSRLPAKIARALHCQTTSLLFPFAFARRQQGDHFYVWARS